MYKPLPESLTIMHSDKSIKKHIYENAVEQYEGFHSKLD